MKKKNTRNETKENKMSEMKLKVKKRDQQWTTL